MKVKLERCLISKAIQSFPDKKYLISDQISLTYIESDFYINKIIMKLKELGIKKKTKVGIYLYNSINYILLLHSLFRINAVAILFNIRNPINSIKKELDRFDISIMFIDKDIDLSSNKYNLLNINKIVNINKKDIPSNISNPKTTKIYNIDYNSDALILFTSGTSGESKAVVHSYFNHVKSAEGSNKNIKIEPGDRWALTLPLYHVGGLSILFRTALNGGAIFVNKNLNFNKEIIFKKKITHLSMVPIQLYNLINNNSDKKYFSKVKAVLIGGASISPELLNKALKLKIPIFISYGSTEMSSQITTTILNDSIEHLYTSGKILPYRKFKINNKGVILVGGETLCKKIFYKNKVKSFKNGEYYETRDIGSLDKDGYLSIRGRIDTMIISGGENIYPEEIEKVLLQNKKIDDAIVVGINNEKYGQILIAFIKTEDIKYDMNNSENINDIIDKLSHFLPSFKIPKYFFKWPDNYEKKGIKNNRSFFQNLAIKFLNN